MQFLTLSALASCLFLLNSCQPPKKETRQSTRELPAGIVDAKPKADSKAENKEIWIDCRTAEEFASGHLDGAINISHSDFETELPKKVENKDTALRLYCRSGNRSSQALEVAKKLGYTKVTNEGGYEDLLKNSKSNQD